MKTRFVTVKRSRLEYLCIGASPASLPTLVFLHEGLGSVSLWRDYPAALCRRTGCGGFVYSRQGHGRSGRPDQPRSARYLHDEALIVLPQLLTGLGIDRPVLIGHSDGASIALIYAGSPLPDPAALILEAPHVFVEEVTVAGIAEARARYETTNMKDKLARYHGDRADDLFRSWSGLWLSPDFRSWNIEEYLPAVACPTLVLQGVNDEYGSSRQVETIAAAVQGPCETHMLDRCGHSPHIDQRAIVETLTTEFILRSTQGDRR